MRSFYNPLSKSRCFADLRSTTGVALFIGLSATSAQLWAQDTPVVASADTKMAVRDDASEGDIIVTAQKREERLLDVPVPVTALSAERLVENNQLRLQDYFGDIPGIRITPANQSNQNIAIRGIPTAGVLIDESPYTPSTSFGGSGQVPDIDPGDLERVEVLRGPQGTLYGASSMGGLVKFITIDPSVAGVSGRVSAGFNTVKDGHKLGYNVRGSVNFPLNEQLAVRVSGFTHSDPGFIDNPFLGTRDVNEQRVSGGRGALLWQASEDVSLKLSALYQRTKGDGSNDELRTDAVLNPFPLGEREQNYIRGTGAYRRTAQAYSATLNAEVAGIKLVSITGYNDNAIKDSFDFSYQLGGLNASFFPGASGAPVFNAIGSKKFTQEVRGSGAIGSSIDWLVGGFYTHEKSRFNQFIYASDPLSGAIVANPLNQLIATTYGEYAAFGDLTFKLSDRFDVQLGARQSHIKQSFQQTQIGVYTPVFSGGLAQDPTVYPTSRSNDDVFTYLITPRFKFTPDTMIYARFASGYRPGAPNLSPVGIPPSVAPDRTKNYEVGFKGSFWDRSLTLDISVFRIDWTNIQVGGFNAATGLTYSFNAGQARSQGVEASATVRPWQGMSVNGWASVSSAKLTETSPSGAKGDRLPFIPKFSASVSATQHFAISGDASAFVGADLDYVGRRVGNFVSPREVYHDYAKLDLRAGVETRGWTASIFANNIADSHGKIGGGAGAFPPFGYYHLRPRELGLSVSKTF